MKIRDKPCVSIPLIHLVHLCLHEERSPPVPIDLLVVDWITAPCSFLHRPFYRKAIALLPELPAIGCCLLFLITFSRHLPNFRVFFFPSEQTAQRTIAQLPQMMLQPEDLLESFVADGTQRVVSSQQVDQAGLSISRSSTPTPSLHSRSCSSSSLNSIYKAQQAQQPSQPPQQKQQETTEGTPVVRQGSSTSSVSATSASPVASVSRESISSQMSEPSLCAALRERLSTELIIVEENQTVEPTTTALSQSTTFVDESPFAPTTTARVSTSSQKAITVDLRWTLIADLFLISISDSVYDSRARVLLKTVGKHLGLDWNEIVLFEKGIMKQLQQQQATTNDGLLKPDTKSRNDESRKRRMIMMGLATVGGGLVLGLSAGLFAPVIGAGIGAALAGAHITGATATAASAFLAGSGGIAVITSGAAVTGSGLAMKKMARRTAGIDTFEFLTIHDHKRVNVILTISGWLDIGDEDASLPFSTLDPINGDHFALFWEPEMLMQRTFRKLSSQNTMAITESAVPTNI